MDSSKSTVSHPLKAAIDIGSNTVLLLVGYVDEGTVNAVYEEHYAPRLGRGVDAEQNLQEEAMDRAIEVLNTYRTVLDTRFKEVRHVVVTATSAVRDAANQAAFVAAIARQTGFQVQVLTGLQEAQCTYAGALAALDWAPESVGVLDIGGGSSEIAVGQGPTLDDYHSYNIGSVRFTERYLTDTPPTDAQIVACRTAIRNAFNKRQIRFPEEMKLVGVAGTVTSLAHMDLNFQHYKPEAINGHTLTLDTIQQQLARIKDRTKEELLERYPELLKGRADVFLAGVLILEQCMLHCGVNEIVVSVGGMRHGAMVLDQAL